MSKPRNSALSRIEDLLGFLGSAAAAAGAVEARRKPEPRHLERLGIDPVQFDRIERF